MNEKRTILLIEDERAISNFICRALTANDYKAVSASSGKEGLSLFFSHCPDLVLLDLGLPDMDGLDVLSQLSGLPQEVPVIIISARDRESEKVKALDMGADDYVVKPFNPLELTARVKSQLRRYTQLNPNSGSRSDAAKNEIAIKGLVINKDNHKVTVYDEEIKLTPIEFDILYLLASNPGKVFSTDEIFEKVWNEKVYEANNTVMVHIRRLRGKMKEDTRENKIITTVWGVGYKIEK